MGSCRDELSVREAFGFMLRGRRRVPEMRVGGVRVGVVIVSLVLLGERESDAVREAALAGGRSNFVMVTLVGGLIGNVASLTPALPC